MEASSSVLTKSKKEVANELVVVFVRSFSSGWMLLELISEFLKKRLSASLVRESSFRKLGCKIKALCLCGLCANIQSV